MSLFQQWKCVLLEMIGRLVKLQKMRKPSAQAQELNSLMIAAKEEDENLTQLQSDFDSLKKIMKEQGESSMQLLSDSTRTTELEEERPAHFNISLKLVRTMEEQGQPPEDHRLRLLKLAEILHAKVEECEDENGAHFQDQLNSARATEMEEERPAHVHNAKYSERYFALRREQTENLPLILTEETVGIKQPWSPLSRWGTKENLYCSFQACGRKEEGSSNEEDGGGFGATPKSQGNDSQGCLRAARTTGLEGVI
jgi:hypothetical protein